MLPHDTFSLHLEVSPSQYIYSKTADSIQLMNQVLDLAVQSDEALTRTTCDCERPPCNQPSLSNGEKTLETELSGILEATPSINTVCVCMCQGPQTDSKWYITVLCQLHFKNLLFSTSFERFLIHS